MQRIIVFFIVLYQRTISPDHGVFRARFPYGYCRHYPTCSEYTRLSVLKFGTRKGVWLGVLRVAQCNPFVEPKIDSVPTDM